MRLLLLILLLPCSVFAQYGDAYHKAYQVDVWRQQSQKNAISYSNNYSSRSSYSAANAQKYNVNYANTNSWVNVFDASNQRRMARRETWVAQSGTVNTAPPKPPTYTGSSKEACQGDCKEILRSDEGGYSYIGNTLNGLPHGNGVITWDAAVSGTVMVAQFDKGYPNGHAIITWTNGAQYEGEINKGQITGFGVWWYHDGTITKGNFKNGVPFGEVITQYPRGSIYKGNYADGARSGFGIYLYNDGTQITGNWKDGNLEGYAVIYYEDGTIEQGWFENDKLVKGQSVYRNGDIFKGYYRDGKRQKGSYISKKNKSIATGSYNEDTKKSWKCIKWVTEDTLTYEGFYAENKKNGYGISYFIDGSKFEGEHANDGPGRTGYAMYTTAAYSFTGRIIPIYGDKKLAIGIVEEKNISTPAYLLTNLTIEKLDPSFAVETGTAAQEAQAYLSANRDAYKACSNIDLSFVLPARYPKADTVLFQKDLQELRAGGTKPGVIDKTVSPVAVDEKSVSKKLTLTGWNEMRNKLTWQWLETPKEDVNVYRYFNEGALSVLQKVNNNFWAQARLPVEKLGGNWEYSATFSMVKFDTEDAEHGLMVTGKANNEEIKLLFYVNPFAQLYWFGTYNVVTHKWATLNSFTGTKYNIFSSAIQKYDAVKNFTTNKLMLRRQGNVIELYINDKLVETVLTSTNGELFKAINGIGIAGHNRQGYYISNPVFSVNE